MVTELKNLPDRELDAWLAEHAMGWSSPFSVCEGGPKDFTAAKDGRYFPIPRFSTDPAASDSLLDKMAELGFGIVISKEPNIGWVCEMCRELDHSIQGRRWWTSAMTTKNRAIAHAAAAALGYGR